MPKGTKPFSGQSLRPVGPFLLGNGGEGGEVSLQAPRLRQLRKRVRKLVSPCRLGRALTLGRVSRQLHPIAARVMIAALDHPAPAMRQGNHATQSAQAPPGWMEPRSPRPGVPFNHANQIFQRRERPGPVEREVMMLALPWPIFRPPRRQPRNICPRRREPESTPQAPRPNIRRNIAARFKLGPRDCQMRV